VRQTFVRLVIGSICAIIVVAFVYFEMGVWRECRQANSWYYCARILAR